MTAARSDERIQPALHALLVGDTDGLCTALEADPDVVNLTVGGNTLLELATQPDVGPPSPAIVEVLVTAGAAGRARACDDGRDLGRSLGRREELGPRLRRRQLFPLSRASSVSVGPAPATTAANPQPPFASSWVSCREPIVRGDRQTGMSAVRIGLGVLSVVVLGLAGCGQDKPIDLAERGGWDRLPDPPLSSRDDANIVGVGDDVIVFGGTDLLCGVGADCDYGDSVAYSDGAAFDRSLNEWRPIADLPVPTLVADTAVLGDQVFALTRGLGPGHRELIAYDVSDDAWVQMDLPDDTAPLGRNSVVATDDTIVLYGRTHEAGPVPGWVFDPAEQSWSELPDDPLGPSYSRSMVWNGETLFLFGKALVESPGGAGGPSYTRAARYEDGAWTALPTADTIGPAPALVDRHRLIAPVLGCADGGQNNNYGRCIPYGAVFDTTTNEWRELPNAPGRGRKDISSYGGISGTDLVAGSTRGAFFDATTDEWFELAPLDSETDPSSSDIENQTFVTRRAASVGDAIVVVGGAEFGPDGGALLADAYMWTL